MRYCTHRSPQSEHFFSKLGHFFPIFEKGQGRAHPLPPLVTRLLSYENLIGKKVNLFKYVKYLNLHEMDSRFLQVGNSEAVARNGTGKILLSKLFAKLKKGTFVRVSFSIKLQAVVLQRH